MTKKTEEAPQGKDAIGKILLGDLYASMVKKHGNAILVRASDFGVQAIPRIPTGNFPLDYALGGGFPVGRVSMCYGHKASAKTSTILKAIANAQKMCANCWTFLDADRKCPCRKYREPVAVYIDVEGALDFPWAQRLGVDLGKMMVSIPEYAEQTLDIADSLVRSGDVDLVALDSIAFLVPSKEIEESTEKAMMGTQPRIVGTGIRKLVSGLNAIGNETGRRPTILLSNQIRMKLGVMFGNPETTPGGLAPGFATSIEAKFWAGKYEMDSSTGKPIYATMNFRIEKNKTAPAKMEGEYKLALSDTETKKIGDVYDEEFMVSQAEKLGLLEKKGGEWHLLGEKFPSKGGAERMAMVSPEFKAKLRTVLFNLLMQV